MKLQTDDPTIQARVASLRYAGSTLRADIHCTSGDLRWNVPVSISGLPQRRMVGIVNAVARILAGALVLDADDLRAIGARVAA
jgi:hypothetical protein